MPAITADHNLSAENGPKVKLDVSVKTQDDATIHTDLPSTADCASHLRLLENFVALRRSVELLAGEAHLTPEQGWNLYCKRAVSRFERWTADVQSGSTSSSPSSQQQPPLDVLMAWHALMLHPKAYARFIELGGPLGINGFEWSEVSSSVTTTTTTISLTAFLDLLEADGTLESLVTEAQQSTGIFTFKTPAGTTVFSYDLAAAINRQFDFSTKMSRYAWLRSPTAEATLAQSVERYRNFFRLIAAHPGKVMVPTLDVDLVWHTHQLSPQRYRVYSKKTAGRLVDHDDDISSETLHELSADMQQLWRDEFGSEYHVCLCWTCEADRARVGPQLVDERLCAEERQRELLPLADLAFPRCEECGSHPETCCPPGDDGAGCGSGCGGGCGGGCGSCGAMK
ncbi:Glycine-rich domain-containing protein 1 [Colletotrichum sidae]|uniref:Glycine-rich domain-containing protein 1 n=1 Tax=Colletotrichum sidae TaxID=1347389 RepID=A0A4R8TEH5_9PEZI|nr:Glycine-rich domain-containing protein 1 [Colletotrichum sidae]